jgi:hypothetical protein
MREDLEYGCKKERFRLRLEDLCYAWAILEEEEKGNLGELVYPNKVGKVSREERYIALYTRWLIGRLLSGIVSRKRYRYYTAIILVKKLKLLSCKKLFLILDRNEVRLKKTEIPRLIEKSHKYLDKNLLKQIEMEALKLADQVSKEKEKEKK